MKKCNKCNIIKHIEDFAKHNQRKDGRHLTCKNCRNIVARSVFSSEKQRISSMKSVYGLSIEQWDEMFLKQKGSCYICGKHQSLFKKRLHTDHNHTTGKVRGLLCAKCNHDLAAVENKEWLEKALNYLKKDE